METELTEKISQEQTSVATVGGSGLVQGNLESGDSVEKVISNVKKANNAAKAADNGISVDSLSNSISILKLEAV